MTHIVEKRSDQRLQYRWPMNFSQSLDQRPSQGRMVSVSSTGAAFICSKPEACPSLGEPVICSFSMPRFDSEISFDSISFKRIARVCRVDEMGDLHHIAVQFLRPLPIKPDAQPISRYDRTYRLTTKSRRLPAK